MLLNGGTVLPTGSFSQIVHLFGGEMLLIDFVECLAFLSRLFQVRCELRVLIADNLGW